MGRYTKEQAIAVVVMCAEKYQLELEGKTLLFLCCNKHMATTGLEFSFEGNNFLHLTGLKLRNAGNSSARDFYNKCLSHKLSPHDFEFAEDGTTALKLDVLPMIINKHLSADTVGDYNSAKPHLHTEKLAGGVKACIGFVTDSDGGRYVPNTVLKEDIRAYANDRLRVLAVYRKDRKSVLYDECTYKAKKVDWTQIRYPQQFAYLEESSQEKGEKL